jgi:hypothetical protein
MKDDRLDRHACRFCGKPCYRICYIGTRLACVDCFKRLAVDVLVEQR